MDTRDQRQAPRFTSELPVRMGRVTGVTRDYSSSGVYFRTAEPVTIGEKVEFILILEHEPTVHEVQINCTGEIVRVEPQTAGYGVAVNLETYTLSCSEVCKRRTQYV